MNALGTIVTSVIAAIAAVVLVTRGLPPNPAADDVAPLGEQPQRVALDKAGAIYVDSPEIYTRERLVNDRYQQDAWLRRRLDLSDTLNFGIQGVRDIRTASQLIMEAKFGAKLDPTANLAPKQESDAPQTAAGNQPDKADTSPARTEAENSDRSPIDDFHDRVAYREEVRSAIIENQLDDRHDLEGNTLYRLKFDATIVPTEYNPHWARIEVKIKPKVRRLEVPDYVKSAPIESRARYLQQAWFDDNPKEAEKWSQVFRRYLDGLSQTLHSQLSNRITALRKVIEDGDSSGGFTTQVRRDLRELRFRIEQIVRSSLERSYYYGPTELNEKVDDIRKRCQGGQSDASAVIPVATNSRQSHFDQSYLAEQVGCMLRNTVAEFERHGPSRLASRTQMLDRVIARGLWDNFNDATSSGRGNTASQSRAENSKIEDLGLSETEGSLVRADPYEYWETLFDIDDLERTEAEALPGYDQETYSIRVCRNSHPEIFREIDEKLSVYGFKLDDERLYRSPFFRIKSRHIEMDPTGMGIICFDNYLDFYRNDGFITFLERFMGEDGQPAHSYAVTPKEAVQRLSDSFSHSQATSALVAVTIAAAALDAETSANAMKELQSGSSGISRFPLVVGYSLRAKSPPEDGQAHELTFGWIVGPRFLPGQDGGLPRFRQVLTQQTLSALISVPAWWPSLDLEITSSWMDIKAGDIEEISTEQHYPDVRLPGDFHEIQRILYPILDKAPKINRDKMESVTIQVTAKDALSSDKTNNRIPVIILGQNLWRSTVVTLDSQRADEIWVMPNMEGIIAHFDRAAVLRNVRSDSATLRVWTSEGMDEYSIAMRNGPTSDAPPSGSQPAYPTPRGDGETEPPPDSNTQPPNRQEQSADASGPPATPPAEDQKPEGSASSGSGGGGGAAQPAEATRAIREASQAILTDKVVHTLSEQAQSTMPLLEQLREDPGRDLTQVKQSLGAIRESAETIAALEESNATVTAIVADVLALEETLEALQTGDGSATPEQVNRQINDLTARLRVLDLEARIGELEKELNDVSVNAQGTVGAAVIQDDGKLRLRKLRILGLSNVKDRNLELSVGVVPATESGDTLKDYLTLPVEDWKAKVVGKVLELQDVEIPVLKPIENGTFVQVVLEIVDPDLRHSTSIRSDNLVFYSNKERATIRVIGPEVKLDPEWMNGTFAVTMPARTYYAFPFSGDNWIEAKASISAGDETIDLHPEFFPLDDVQEADLKENKELTLNMALDLSGNDQKLLQSHLEEHGKIPVELEFGVPQPGEVPTIDNNLFIGGFAKPRS